MKVIGMIGGIGPESTIDYYRRLLAVHRERAPDGPAPAIIINSIDLQKGLDLLGANQLVQLTEYLVPEIGRLARAGAEFGFLAANSPHIVFDDLARRLADSAAQHCGSHLRGGQSARTQEAGAARNALHHAGDVLSESVLT